MCDLPTIATCRGCRRELKGKPYHTGQPAFIPETGKQCPRNYYGGHVCSSSCDYKASLELEETMPGHGGQKELSRGSESYRSWQRNWSAS